MKPEENGNMLFFKRLLAIALSAALLGPIAPLHARTRKGDRFLTEGRAFEAKKDWDAAMEDYQKALAEDPSDIEYQMASEKARVQAGQMHVEKGVKIRGQGMLGEALLEFQRGFTVNPSSAVAVQEIRTTQEMIERERQRVLQTGKESSPEDRGLTPLQQLRKEQEQQLDRLLPAPQLKPLSPRRIDLKINNADAKTLFITLGKYAGINVLWDPNYATDAGAAGVKAQSVDFQNSTLEEALDYLSIITKSFWKPLSANTIFVTVESRAKRNDYEDNVLRIFYLSNIQTTAELQEIVNVVRAVTEAAHMFPFSGQNAIVVRGEADKVRLVEKIIHDLDRPKAEVLMDIVVMETNSVYSRQLAAALAPTGLNIPGNFTPRSGMQVVANANTTGTTSTSTSTTGTGTSGTTTTGSTSSTSGAAIPLSNLGHLASSDWSTTLPSALLQAVMSDANSKVLQAPQLRSVDQTKATLKIGDREPTASGSFSPGIGAVGMNSLVNTQFQYIDVGVNVDMTPRVHDNGDVSLHIELDISTVNGQVNLGGINQPIIGQRKVSHDIRLREGEVALLGGLTKLQDTKTKTGTPGLSSIPFLGRLFSGESIDRERSELMIAIVPHVIRRPEFTAENLRSILVGTSQTIKLSYAPEEPPDALAPAAPAAPAAPVTPPAGTMPAAPAPGGAALPAAAPPDIAPAAGGPPATAPPAAGLPATAPSSPGAPPAAALTARFMPANIEAAASGTFAVELALEGGADVVLASPISIGFDPKLLSLVDVAAGGLFAKDGQQPVFSRNIQNDMGLATIQCGRPPDAPGVSGPGTLLVLRFQTLGHGATSVTGNMTIRNSHGLVIGSPTPQLSVNLK